MTATAGGETRRRIGIAAMAGVATMVAACGPVEVGKLVFVECGCDRSQSFAEAEWVSGLPATEPRLRGIVAHVSLEKGDAAEADLARLAALPLVKGVIAALKRRGFEHSGIFLVGLNALRLRMTGYLPSLVSGSTPFSGNPVFVLESGRYSVGEIAARVGYTGQAAFAVAFQRKFHVAPSSVRRRPSASRGSTCRRCWHCSASASSPTRRSSAAH